MNVFPQVSFEVAETLYNALSKDIVVFEPSSGMAWAFGEETWYYQANAYNYKVLRQMQQVNFEDHYVYIFVEFTK